MTNSGFGDEKLEYTMEVASTWSGEAVDEGARLSFAVRGATLLVEIDARFYGDPRPDASPGWTEGLWNYEVVELFLAYPDGRYAELEFGPHGHYLGLLFSGPRSRSGRWEGSYSAGPIGGDRWHARWEGLLPWPAGGESTLRANAFAIHGLAGERHHHVAASLPGKTPDFHQPRLFPGLARWRHPRSGE